MGFLEHFQEYNKTPKNIFQNIFWNATKHLKIFFFPENIYFSKYFLECNKTLENIFLSRKYLFFEKYFTRTKHSLKDYHALKMFFNPTSIY